MGLDPKLAGLGAWFGLGLRAAPELQGQGSGSVAWVGCLGWQGLGFGRSGSIGSGWLGRFGSGVLGQGSG